MIPHFVFFNPEDNCRKGAVMKKDTTKALIEKGILVGGFAGFTVILYRMALEFTGTALTYILNCIDKRPFFIFGWFLILLLLTWTVGRLAAYEPMISGSGLPQLEGEMTGTLDLNWRRVIPAKFAAGFLCLSGGLALGRAGPSILLGAMSGKGISEKLKQNEHQKKILLTCGAGAGLAATFHAPLTGAVFAMEKLYKDFSAAVMAAVMAASLTADILASLVFGAEPIFTFGLVRMLPVRRYWLLPILGILLGFSGVFYSWFSLKVRYLYNKITRPGTWTRFIVPFLCAGILAFTAPEILGSGYSMIPYLTGADLMLGTLLLLFIIRFLFSAVCFGSGAPGGIFFPLLILGCFIGRIFAAAGIQLFGLDSVYINNFLILAMAGYFSAIIHAPLTGVILLFEMTGSPEQLFSLTLVSAAAYITSSILNPKSLNDCLFEKLK